LYDEWVTKCKSGEMIKSVGTEIFGMAQSRRESVVLSFSETILKSKQVTVERTGD
jgi:hypothetical protein